MSEISNQFNCAACGRKFTWKPEIAGKRAKCKCGSTIEVPKSVSSDDEPEDMYDLAAAMPPPIAQSSTPTPQVMQAVAQPLNYQSAPPPKTRLEAKTRNDSMISKPKDIYAPVIMISVGFILVMAWAILNTEAGALGAAIAGVLLFVVTLVKTVVLVLAAFGIAAGFGVSFGSFWTAILKLAAIVIFTEAIFIWIEVGLEHIGAITPKGRVRGFSLIFLLQAAIYAVQYRVLFDMESEGLMKIGGITALISRIIDFGFKILIGMLIGG